MMKHGDVSRNGFQLIMLGIAFSLTLLSGCSSPGKKEPEKKTVEHKYQRSNAGTHKVVSGDTLYAIAWKAGVDYKTLASWNRLRSPYSIYPGQVLRLKPSSSSSRKTTSKYQPKAKPKPTVSKKPPITTKPVKPKSKSPNPTTTANSLHWQWPTEGRLLSTFKAGDSARTGIKIVGKKGQKIYAAESGEIVYVGGGLIGYGQLIIIKHNNKYLSAYGHNSRLLVTEGQTIKKGKHIADMGSVNSGKAMLHFEIRKYGKPTDPRGLLPRK